MHMEKWTARRLITIALFLVALLALSGCIPQAQTGTPPSPPSGETVVTEEANPIPNEPIVEAYPSPELPAYPPAQQPPVAGNPYPEPSVEPTAITEQRPTPSPDLHATDPSTVSLASGQLQFVEFFAFW